MSTPKQHDEKTAEETAAAEPVEPVETFYDDAEEPHRMAWARNAGEAVCGAAGKARDGVLRAVPADVTAHLVNSHNELMKAGIAFVESGIHRAEKIRERATDLHKKPAE